MSLFNRRIFLFIALAELLSLFSFLLPNFSPITFWTILVLFLVISLHKLEWGLYILLVELIIGSKGYLFAFEQSGVIISIRIAFFIIFMSVWLSRFVSRKNRLQLYAKIKDNKKFIIYYLLLVAVIAIGIVNGLVKKYSFNDVFFDFNGWLYFALFVPFLDIINVERTKKIFQIFAVAIAWTALKTLIVLYCFTHPFIDLKPLYKWIRDSGVGEITLMEGGFSRIFFQSQIYILVGFFIISTLIIYNLIKKEKINILFYIIHILITAALITSLSRSFFIGATAGIIILLAYLIFQEKIDAKNIAKIIGGLIVSIVLSIGLIIAIIKIPPSSSDIEGRMLQERFINAEQSIGGSSRINQLKPLFAAISKHPILGSGFGKTITYQNEDLRIKTELNPEGWRTTYAFEWGYLDIILKIGLLGLVVYLFFIAQIFKNGYKFIIHHLPAGRQGSSFIIQSDTIINYQLLIIGLLLGLIALLVTSIFSPYLNHPLGIGYIMLITVIFITFTQKNEAA